MKLRNTKNKQIIIDLLIQSEKPLSVHEMIDYLSKNNLSLNKTVLYRNLMDFKSQGLVEEINFSDGVKRYEIQDKHHHHLVCTQCNYIQHIDHPKLEKIFDNLENEVLKHNQFLIIEHNLEFFGLCRNCKS